jgi:hypothetical protein
VPLFALLGEAPLARGDIERGLCVTSCQSHTNALEQKARYSITRRRTAFAAPFIS